ncbi:MAG: CotH kinase family protein [Eubacteriales bacterium]|nr:CotH kinase family protein [Eubacteriales bacterium]
MSELKLIKIVLLFCSVAILLFFLQGLNKTEILVFSTTNNSRLTQMMCDETTYQEIMKSRQPAQTELLTALSFNEYSLAYDSSSKTYYYSVIESDTNQYNPIVQFSCTAKNAKIAVLSTILSAESVRSNQRCTLLLYTDDTYTEYNIVLTTLPIMQIDVDSVSDDPDMPVGTEYVLGQISLFDNGADAAPMQRTIISQAKVHIRGASSQLYPQKCYRISLTVESLGDNLRNNHVSLLGMRQDDDWILYAPYDDPEKIRSTFSTNLWWGFGAGNNSFGITNGTQGKFVEVLINGRYWGVYCLMHPIDAKQLCLNESTDPEEAEYFYRSISYEATTSQMFHDAANSTVAGRFELRYPETNFDTYLKWAPLDAYEQLLSADDSEFLEQITSAVDMDNSIDLWLFINLTLAVDNSGKNLNYIAKIRNGEYVMLFSPWDLDQTWGSIWTQGAEFLTEVRVDAASDIGVATSAVTRGLELGMEGLAKSIQGRYAELRQTVLSDASIYNMLSQYEADIYGSGAILRNIERWPFSAYEPSMDSLETYVLARLAYMDSYIAGLTGENE